MEEKARQIVELMEHYQKVIKKAREGRSRSEEEMAVGKLIGLNEALNILGYGVRAEYGVDDQGGVVESGFKMIKLEETK